MKNSSIAFALLAMAWFSATNASASVIVPSGLNPGDTYQLVFVTSGTRNASSTSIADYNSFVQSQGDAGSLTGGSGIDWYVIGSTITVAARNNAVVSAPVYLVNGTQVATGYTDFWDGNLLSAISIDQNGSTVAGNVATGSYIDGTNTWPDSLRLGDSVILFGDSSLANNSWIYHQSDWNYNSFHFYALSQVLTVPQPLINSPVPEPASLAMLGMAGIATLGTFRRSRLPRGH